MKESTVFSVVPGKYYIVFLQRGANVSKEEIEYAFSRSSAIVTIIYTDETVRVVPE